MIHVTIAFEGELRDHLQPTKLRNDAEVSLDLPAGLRDVVQSRGVPHVECAGVSVNDVARSWDYRVADGDVIVANARYPLPASPSDPKFLLDDHLGKLARDLRMLGFDTEHEVRVHDADLAARSVADGRILLTRDRGLLMRSALREGRFVRSVEATEQAIEVVRSFALAPAAVPLSRCLECNGVLITAHPDEVADRVPPSTAARHDRFSTCPGCRRVYWEGSHVDDLRTRIRVILDAATARGEAGGSGPRV